MALDENGDPGECRIIWRKAEEGKTEISVFWVAVRRETRTGMLANNDIELESLTWQLKDTLERAKNRVWVKGYI